MPEIQECDDDCKDTSDYPDKTAETVCFVPVFFTCQSPWEFYTHSVILLSLRKKITDYYKQNTAKKWGDDFDSDAVTKSVAKDYGVHEY